MTETDRQIHKTDRYSLTETDRYRQRDSQTEIWSHSERDREIERV